MADEFLQKAKAFISYSWSSPAHEQRVLELADRLIRDGVEIIIDKYDLAEGQDVHAFMERMVTDPAVTKVIIICDKAYAEKADKRERGVGKEALIISNEVYSKADQKRFIPVVFETEGTEFCLPRYLKGRFVIDMSTPEAGAEHYEQLVRALYEKPLYRKPELGQPPAYLLTPRTTSVKTTGKLLTATAAVTELKPYADSSIQDYFRAFVGELDDFRASPTEGEPLDERVLERTTAFRPYRDEFVALIEFLCTYRDAPATYDLIFEFFQESPRATAAPADATAWDPRWGDSIRFIVGELFMHTVAVLLKRGRFAGVRTLVTQDYLIPQPHSQDQWRAFDVFEPRIASFEHDRRNRLKLNFVSVSTEILKSRATGTPVTFEELAQADLVLFLVSLLDAHRTHRMWMPYTLLYRQRWSPLPLFVRAESNRYFAGLKLLFGVASREELVQKISDAEKPFKMDGSLWISASMSSIDYAELANLQKLDSRP